METHKNTPVFLFKTPDEWEKWLSENHDKFFAIWIKFAKKGSGEVSISYEEAVPVALCYGWIDSLLNKLDEKFYVVKFTPRKAQSVWSKRNKEIVAELIQKKKIQTPGLTAIKTAMANGQWENAYDTSKDMEIPDDFLKELAKNKKAQEFFNSLNRANTYAIGWRLQTAKRPETRQKRINDIVAMLRKGEKFH